MGCAVHHYGMGATAQSVIDVNPNWFDWPNTSMQYWSDYMNGIRNLDGTYTAKGKAQMVADQAAALVHASGGTMTPAQAQAQATSDVTANLTANNADPSQSPFALPSWLKWGAIAAAAALGIILIRD